MNMFRTSYGDQKDFDVTEYGAIPDGKTESSQAFLDAWNASCAYNGSARFLIPQGTFYVYPVSFTGPCYNNSSPKVDIQGTLVAPLSLSHFPNDIISWIEFKLLNELIVGGGGVIDGKGAQVWPCVPECAAGRLNRKMPINLLFSTVSNTIISDLTLTDSKGVHLKVQRSANVTVHDINISSPADSPNTDGIYTSRTHCLNLTNINIATGDDCIAIGQGSTDIFVSKIVCGPGHGLSVGSLGGHDNEDDVNGLIVKNCTVLSADNGVRIKTWPGSEPGKASNITFEDIIMHNVSNPILIDQGYCPRQTHCPDQPSLIQLQGITFKGIWGTTVDEVAVRLECSEARPCQDVSLQDINLAYVGNEPKNITSSCSFVLGQALGMQSPDPCSPLL
ncbi:hypothetical protein J5N97_015250 [Dioscorea zingiberensis]|uniref:Exopolygalacturonase n=1 Tax=Dioscorea zingiberensis TaxID=325984 RepID=A0A9D5CTX9_9LILI|nr:hypothetical protein J5N97_015250 [Dioscorea zingiberensis]